MNFLIRSDKELASQVEGLIISEVADDKLEEKLEEIEKVEGDPAYVQEDATAANESIEYGYLFS